MHPPRPSDIQRVPRLGSAIDNMKLNSETPYYYADKDIGRSCSLFALAREEIDKTNSLDCLQHMTERGENVEGLLFEIATAFKGRLDTTTPRPALKLLVKVLQLFYSETYNGSATDERFLLMSIYEDTFAIGLGRAGIASPLVKLAFAAKNVGQDAVSCMIRLEQLCGKPFRDQLVAAGCAQPLLEATTAVFTTPHREVVLQLIERLLIEVGEPFASQVAMVKISGSRDRGGFHLMRLWGDVSASASVRDYAFSCSELLLRDLGAPWARRFMSAVPMLLQRVSGTREDVSGFATDITMRMLGLLKAPFAAKLEEAGALDWLLGAFLNGDARTPNLEREIDKVLLASESDPVIHQRLASKMATTPIINRLVSTCTATATRVLHRVVRGVPELAHQLIAAGAIPRCVDALKWQTEWVPTTVYVPGPDAHFEDGPPKLKQAGRTKSGEEADALLSTLFEADATQKIKAFLHYEKRDDVSVATFDSNGSFAYPSLKTAYMEYRKGVLLELVTAFHHSTQQPHYPTLVEVAARCDEHGSPEEVLARLGHRLQQHKLRVEKKAPMEASPSEQLDHDRLVKRLTACVLTLTKPTTSPRGQLAQFTKLMPPSMLPFTPALALMPPGLTPMALSPPNTAMLLSPPPPPPPPAAPLALMPPAPPPLNDYLSGRVLRRTDCAKCVVARGPDASVREGFATDGGKGRVRNVSLKRACPLAAHAISASGDGVPVIEQYERDYGVKLTNKKQKFQEFMSGTFGVDPLGKGPSFKVTLYHPPRVGASLALEGGAVKLNLASLGYTPTSEQGTKDNYMGFMIV